MKQHKIRELVNELRDTALKYYNHQSLREHIANKIIPVLEELDQSKVLEHYRDMLEEQKLIIRALKGTCGDMGTTDMFTALIRKDAEIARLREDLAVLEDGLAADKAMDAALRQVDANTIQELKTDNSRLRKTMQAGLSLAQMQLQNYQRILQDKP